MKYKSLIIPITLICIAIAVLIAVIWFSIPSRNYIDSNINIERIDSVNVVQTKIG